jgi:hypothetical protein
MITGEAKEAGIRLGDLCERRNKADYELSDNASGERAFARDCVEQAHRVRSLLGVCKAADAETHRAMRESIDAWRTRSKL